MDTHCLCGNALDPWEGQACTFCRALTCAAPECRSMIEINGITPSHHMACIVCATERLFTCSCCLEVAEMQQCTQCGICDDFHCSRCDIERAEVCSNYPVCNECWTDLLGECYESLVDDESRILAGQPTAMEVAHPLMDAMATPIHSNSYDEVGKPFVGSLIWFALMLGIRSVQKQRTLKQLKTRSITIRARGRTITITAHLGQSVSHVRKCLAKRLQTSADSIILFAGHRLLEGHTLLTNPDVNLRGRWYALIRVVGGSQDPRYTSLDFAHAYTPADRIGDEIYTGHAPQQPYGHMLTIQEATPPSSDDEEMPQLTGSLDEEAIDLAGMTPIYTASTPRLSPTVPDLWDLIPPDLPPPQHVPILTPTGHLWTHQTHTRPARYPVPPYTWPADHPIHANLNRQQVAPSQDQDAPIPVMQFTRVVAAIAEAETAFTPVPTPMMHFTIGQGFRDYEIWWLETLRRGFPTPALFIRHLRIRPRAGMAPTPEQLFSDEDDDLGHHGPVGPTR